MWKVRWVPQGENVLFGRGGECGICWFLTTAVVAFLLSMGGVVAGLHIGPVGPELQPGLCQLQGRLLGPQGRLLGGSHQRGEYKIALQLHCYFWQDSTWNTFPEKDFLKPNHAVILKTVNIANRLFAPPRTPPPLKCTKFRKSYNPWTGPSWLFSLDLKFDSFFLILYLKGYWHEIFSQFE